MTSEDLVFDFERVCAHGFEVYEGTALDVRTVIAGLPRDVRDGFLLEEVPWGRFSHAYGSGEDVPDYLERTRSADAAEAREARSSLGNSVCHQGTTGSVAPLMVPFLLRIAADRIAHERANALALVAAVACRNHWGDGSRAALLRVADADDDMHFDVGGYPQNWSVRAARDAIAADAHIPIALLHDPDPRVREQAACVLAASSGRAREISAALHERFRVEEVPRLRAGLVLAIAQPAREHRHEDAAAFTRACWSDPARSPEVRVAAALGWLCLVDDPAPEDLRAVLDELVTHELGLLMAEVPWIRQVDHYFGAGLTHTLNHMFDPVQRPAFPDTWGEPEGFADDPPF
ncbi:HEAT repeat domain-containing protein [Embleya scabrispora]|uniref:HEAT repeat domain-containing protein n=1 Tax=Embleya scabrispora TaxID=159449 RepID=UPI0003A167DC|nr:HEAT repeat domain-containing protein [Embleya scabrispora]MYS81106.1 HEAT repeat domain-containing protein [Streptomyces sp. SID5474]